MGQTVNRLAYAFGGSNPSLPTKKIAEVAQLIEHQPSKLRVASLSLVFRSIKRGYIASMYPLFLFLFCRLKYRLCSKPELFPYSLAVSRSIAGCFAMQNIGEVSRSDGGVENSITSVCLYRTYLFSPYRVP